jgi:hypothetical protein
MTPFVVPCDGNLPLPFWQVPEIVLLFCKFEDGTANARISGRIG